MGKPASVFIPVQLQLREEDFDFFSSSLLAISGIHLPPAKKNLVQGRLQSEIERLGFHDFRDYRRHLETLPRSHEHWREFTNRLTTNKTEWFREIRHFEYLKKVLVQWKKPRISVWSAACSSGEEAYTLAMVLSRYSKLQYDILATDIDSNMLAIGRNGVYKSEGLQNVPQEYQSCFSRGNARISEWMKIRDEYKQGLAFEQLNLVEPCPFESKFDLIFCRNVLIYFQKDVVAKVIANLYRAAAPGAFLFIGQSESLHNIRTDWKYVGPSVFQKES